MNLSEDLITLITERKDIAYKRAVKNPILKELSQQQNKSEKRVDEFLMTLKKEERLLIRQHYEGEVLKMSFEDDEVYIQGLSDAFGLMVLLGKNI